MSAATWCEVGQLWIRSARVGCRNRPLGRYRDGTGVCAEHLRQARRCRAAVGRAGTLCGRTGKVEDALGFFYCDQHRPAAAKRR